MSFSTGEQASAALAALGHKLDERGTEPVSLLICGGAALNISGLLTRLTADVDVLGDMHANGNLGEMPEWIYLSRRKWRRSWAWRGVGSTTSQLRWLRWDFLREFFSAQRDAISEKDCKSP